MRKSKFQERAEAKMLELATAAESVRATADHHQGVVNGLVQDAEELDRQANLLQALIDAEDDTTDSPSPVTDTTEEPVG